MQVQCSLCGDLKKYSQKNKRPCPYRKTHKWIIINTVEKFLLGWCTTEKVANEAQKFVDENYIPKARIEDEILKIDNSGKRKSYAEDLIRKTLCELLKSKTSDLKGN